MIAVVIIYTDILILNSLLVRINIVKLARTPAINEYIFLFCLVILLKKQSTNLYINA